MASTTKMTSLKGMALPSTRPSGTVEKHASLTHAMVVGIAAGPSRVRARTVCEAKPLDKVATAVITGAPALLAASPAFAKLNVGMNTEGTGLILGINDAASGWAILIVFGLVWAVYATSAKGLGGGESDDSGLTL